MTARLGRLLAVIAALFTVVFTMLTGVASAATDATTTHASLISDTMIVSWLTTAVIAVVIPAITDFITKSTAPKFVKNAVVIVLSAVAAAIPMVTFVHGERWTDYVFAVFVAFWTALTAHRTGYSQPIQDATAGFGIGPAVTPAAPVLDGSNPVDDSDADTGDTGAALPPELPATTNINDLHGGNV